MGPPLFIFFIDNRAKQAHVILAYLMNTELFWNHMSTRKPYISWGAMHCHDCRTNVNKAAVEKRRMAYCAQCELYFCETCLELEKLCFCDTSPVYIT